MENIPASAIPPTQARSLRSMNRILDAAESLLADVGFDDLSIQDIIKKADTSVGVFYARFKDKEAMIAALCERHQQQVIDELAQRDQGEGQSLETIIRYWVHGLIVRYRGNKGLYRALVMRGHERPDWRYNDPKARESLSIAQFGTTIAAHRDRIGHPKPKQAASLAYLIVIATLREKILFGESTASALRISDKALENELHRAVSAYLEVKP
jgi:AcrR family transcriptional regulator